MLLDLSRLQRSVEIVNRRYEPAAFGPPDPEFSVVAPVELTGSAHREGKTTIVLTARVTTTLEVSCGRCLEPIQVPVDAKVETRFVPAGELAKATASAVEHEVKAEDLGLDEYRDDTIDLGRVVREQLYLVLPMKPLCQDECRGLCPQCGVNRNRDTCACRDEWEDPRLAPLKELKKRIDREP